LTQPPLQIFVLGSDGNLWLENGPFGQVPPPRVPVDGNVDLCKAFYALDQNTVYVCGSDGNLWLEYGPFGQVPLPPCNGQSSSCRVQVDGSVAWFWPVNDYTGLEQILVLGQDGKLWLEYEPFGQVPPPRVQIDANVAAFGPGLWGGDISPTSGDVLVVGDDLNLWDEVGPFGQVPLPDCNGQSSSCRNRIDGNVIAFQPLWGESGEARFGARKGQRPVVVPRGSAVRKGLRTSGLSPRK